MALRADGAESAGKVYKLDKKTFACADIWALHHDISDPQRANQDDEVNLDRGATVLLTQDAMIRKELNFVDAYMKDSVWTYSVDGAASRSATFTALTDANNNLIYWSAANSTPIQDIRLLKRIIHSSTGFRPNVLVLGRAVFDILLDHPDIVARLDRGQTTGPVMASRESLAALFELEEILIMDAVVNSATEGATDSIDFIGDRQGWAPGVPDSGSGRHGPHGWIHLQLERLRHGRETWAAGSTRCGSTRGSPTGSRSRPPTTCTSSARTWAVSLTASSNSALRRRGVVSRFELSWAIVRFSRNRLQRQE